MGDHPCLVKILGDTEAIAADAGACGVVEGKQAGLEFVDRMAALRAGVACREQQGLPGLTVHRGNRSETIGQFEGGLKGFRKAQSQVLPDFEAVDDHVNGMLAFFVQGRDIIEIDQDAVDPDPYETRGTHLFEHVQVLALAVAYHGCQQHQFAALGQGQHRIHHLAHGLRLQGDAVLGTAWISDPSKQQAQVIVNFSDGANGGARVVGRGFLFYRNCR